MTSLSVASRALVHLFCRHVALLRFMHCAHPSGAEAELFNLDCATVANGLAKAYGTSVATPKAHSIIHYAAELAAEGPFRDASTMSFESDFASLKHLHTNGADTPFFTLRKFVLRMLMSALLGKKSAPAPDARPTPLFADELPESVRRSLTDAVTTVDSFSFLHIRNGRLDTGDFIRTARGEFAKVDLLVQIQSRAMAICTLYERSLQRHQSLACFTLTPVQVDSPLLVELDNVDAIVETALFGNQLCIVADF